MLFLCNIYTRSVTLLTFHSQVMRTHVTRRLLIKLKTILTVQHVELRAVNKHVVLGLFISHRPCRYTTKKISGYIPPLHLSGSFGGLQIFPPRPPAKLRRHLSLAWPWLHGYLGLFVLFLSLFPPSHNQDSDSVDGNKHASSQHNLATKRLQLLRQSGLYRHAK